MVFNGNRGRAAAALQRFMISLPDATRMTLIGFLSSNTADTVADRSECLVSALMDFLRRRDPEPEANRVSPSEGREEFSAFLTL